MARTNKISYRSGSPADQQALAMQAALAAPASAAPATQVTTGEAQKNNIVSAPITQAAQNYVNSDLINRLAGTQLGQYVPSTSDVTDPTNFKAQGQFGNTWSPTVYNQNALNTYDQGLQQAKDWDAQSSLSPGFKQRVYQILNGQRPEAQLSQYVPNAAQTASVTPLNDGSTMMNPSNPAQAQQWNVQKLRADHPDWDNNTLQNFMNQQYNWKSYNALVNAGYIQPTQASQDWTAYQQEQARQAAIAAQQAQYGSLPQYYQPDTSGYVEDTGGYVDNSQPSQEETLAPSPAPQQGDSGYTISAPSGVYETPDTSYYSSVGDAVRDKNNYWKSLFGL